MDINYVHSEKVHSLPGPQAALPAVFANEKPASLLDVGCGTGTWMKAAIDFGIRDVFGVDGITIPPEKLHVPAVTIRTQDLTRPWTLNKQFDAVLCLEVGEHLEAEFAPILIDALVGHSAQIYFSAACPDQPGQHHVNCQWPTYWQKLFNDRGYVCQDEVRRRIWEIKSVEPWYKQNVFTARRAPSEAGKEPRIPSVIHPEMMPLFQEEFAVELSAVHVNQIRNGSMSSRWYMSTPFHAIWAKCKRKLK